MPTKQRKLTVITPEEVLFYVEKKKDESPEKAFLVNALQKLVDDHSVTIEIGDVVGKFILMAENEEDEDEEDEDEEDEEDED